MMMSKRGGANALKSTDIESNSVLFIEGLTKATPTQSLNKRFSNFPGFKEVRHVVEKQVAFVEFENDDQAGFAMAQQGGAILQDSDGQDVLLRVTFAKR